MSGTRRNNQWTGYPNWAAPEAQHQQYSNPGVDRITDGIAGVSIQNSNYGQGGQYYQNGPYPYPQQGSCTTQGGSFPKDSPYIQQGDTYPQTGSYPEDIAYGQETQYGGGNYDYRSPRNADQDNSYTASTQQHFPTQTSKGKSKAVDPPTNRTKASREKTRERDRDAGKGKSSLSKNNRSKYGRSQAENEYGDELPPFYSKSNTGPVSGPSGPLQENSDLSDPAQLVQETMIGPSDDYSGYDVSHATIPLASDQQIGYDDSTGQDNLSGYSYTEQYTGNDPATSRQATHRSSRSHKQKREDKQTVNQPELHDPYASNYQEEIADLLEESRYSNIGGSSYLSGADPSIDPSMDNTNYQYEDGAGVLTPRASTPLATMTSNFPATSKVGQAELDDRFIVEHSSRFYAGEVFKVLWSEPLGSRADGITDASARSVMGERFYVGIRRFIVVRTDEGHSTCVPILTYERRACTKKGVKVRTHGIIYPTSSKPRLLEGEPILGCPPVRIELDFPSERIVKESRVNYSKLVTVEHNIKVFFIGRIAPEDFALVDDSVNRCWEHKNKSQKDRDRRHRDYHHRSYRS